MARSVPFVSPEQAEAARYYRSALGLVSFVLFVDIVGNPEDEDEFIVFVGGAKKYGEQAVQLGTETVLNGLQAKRPEYYGHRFKVETRLGYLASRFDDEGSGEVPSLPEREDGEVQS